MSVEPEDVKSPPNPEPKDRPEPDYQPDKSDVAAVKAKLAKKK